MDKPIYIHYGHDSFVKPNPIYNRPYFTKPTGGLWASRKEGEQTWKSWCECEDFRMDSFDRSFEFMLKDGARVLELNREEQLSDLPKEYGSRWKLGEKPYGFSDSCWLDFEELEKLYDAVEVTDINHLYWPLYGWDCNSILIMNPDIVDVIPKAI